MDNNCGLVQPSTYNPVMPGWADDVLITVFSMEGVFDVLRTNKNTTGIGPDSLSSASSMHDAVALWDAFTSLDDTLISSSSLHENYQ